MSNSNIENQQSTNVESAVNRPDRRYSITKVFSSALISTLLLFMVVTSLAFFKLIDFRVILSNITDKSIPSVALSSQIYSQVNSLTYLTEGLTKTTNLASRRISERNINQQLLELAKLAGKDTADPFFNTQLKALKLEISELNELVGLRLSTEAHYLAKQEQMYLVYDDVVALSTSSMGGMNNSKTIAWTLTLADMVALAGKTASLNRLHAIRQIEKQLKQKAEILLLQVTQLTDAERKIAQPLADEMIKLLMADDGLISSQIEQLRISGRVIGRGNFVRNLILDYARLAEFQAFKLNETIIRDTQLNTIQVSQQIRVIGIASAIAILFLIFVVYFLQKNVVSRLVDLNLMVKKKLDGEEAEISLSGNDEISDIALSFNVFAKTVEKQNQILQDLSLSDGLTGIANRRAFDEKMLHETRLAKRNNWPVTILLLDVDFFKPYNDKYGHGKGDVCLQQIAQILSTNMQRETDFVARYGGEEFVCILPNTEEGGAQKVAASLLKAIEDAHITHEYSEVSSYVTASIGMSTFHFSLTQEIDGEILLKKADQALYQAKALGRNRCVAAPMEAQPPSSNS